MSKKWNGMIVEKHVPHFVEVETSFNGQTNKRRTRLMLDCYVSATILDFVSNNAGTEDKEANMTVTVALASINQVRRVTAFGKDIEELKKLKRGDVLDIAGQIIVAAANGGTPGFRAMVFGDIKEHNTLPAETEPASLGEVAQELADAKGEHRASSVEPTSANAAE